MTITNNDIGFINPNDAEMALVTRMDLAKDIVVTSDSFDHELNPVTKDNIGAKVRFDCTYPVPKPDVYCRTLFQDMKINDYDIK